MTISLASKRESVIVRTVCVPKHGLMNQIVLDPNFTYLYDSSKVLWLAGLNCHEYVCKMVV